MAITRTQTVLIAGFYVDGFTYASSRRSKTIPRTRQLETRRRGPGDLVMISGLKYIPAMGCAEIAEDFTEEQYDRLVYHRKAGINTTGTPEEQPFIELCRHYFARYPLSRERLAWHEAGHAVIGHRLGFKVAGVEQISPEHWVTEIESSPPFSTEQHMISVAGYLSEGKACGHGDPAEAHKVAWHAQLLFGFGPDQRLAYVRSIEAKTIAILDEHWEAVGRFAQMIGQASYTFAHELAPALDAVPFGSRNEKRGPDDS